MIDAFGTAVSGKSNGIGVDASGRPPDRQHLPGARAGIRRSVRLGEGWTRCGDEGRSTGVFAPTPGPCQGQAGAVTDDDVRRRGAFGSAAKRVFDVIGALVGLLVLAPVFVAVAISVYLWMGGPVFFCQDRPGHRGRPFRLYKFRSMSDAVDDNGRPLADTHRLTVLGRFLRRSSLDELPQLWNVLRGDLSLVGPRPLLMEYLDRYDDEQARRHDVRPGLTGWTQVHGRNNLAWEQKFALDLWYVDHGSFWLDLRILAKTVGVVLRRRGTSHPGQETMPAFQLAGPQAAGARRPGLAMDAGTLGLEG